MHSAIYIFYDLENPFTHIGCPFGGKGTHDQVQFLCKAMYSYPIAFLQCSYWRASLTVEGSFVAVKAFGLKLPDLALVCVLWVFVWTVGI